MEKWLNSVSAVLLIRCLLGVEKASTNQRDSRSPFTAFPLAEPCVTRHAYTEFKALPCGAAACPDGHTLRKCARCLNVKYCSSECQREHYPTHKTQCNKK